MKKLLLAVALGTAFATSAFAQTGSSIPPRDPPFGKGIPDNDSMHQPSAGGSGYGSSAADDSIPPRDPPFGKGELRDDAPHPPSAAVTQGKASDGPGKGEAAKSAKKEAKTRSALKKDHTKAGTKPDSAPTSDTD